MNILCAGFKVRSQDADRVRRLLKEKNMMIPNTVPVKEDGKVVFPVRLPINIPIYGILVSREFPVRDRGPRSYKALLKGKMPDDLYKQLPSSFDVVGDIVIMKVPDALIDYVSDIGRAVMEANSAIRAVFLDGGVKDVKRVRSLRMVAGSGDAVTSHRENGLALTVDLVGAYFSPRLAAERVRVIDMLPDGCHLLDMFAGVGPFAILAAKRKDAKVMAFDINPRAVELLESNARRNGVEYNVIAKVGDARRLAHELLREGIKFDAIIMNLPHGAFSFLDLARELVVDDGIIFYYEIMENDRVQERKVDLKHMGFYVSKMRIVHPYSPFMSMWCFHLTHKHNKII